MTGRTAPPSIPPGLLERMRTSRHLVVFTGAGVSQESGIPTFRDALTGLWARFDAEQLATPEAFMTDPALVWGWYEWRRGRVLRCQPNAAHRACRACRRPHGLPDIPPEIPEDGAPLPPPLCARCGGRIRPGVVWFGESLPADAWRQARQAIAECGLFLSVGTASLVYPAALLPRQAGEHGAQVVQINPATTALDALVDFNLRGTAARILPALVAQAWPVA